MRQGLRTRIDRVAARLGYVRRRPMDGWIDIPLANATEWAQEIAERDPESMIEKALVLIEVRHGSDPGTVLLWASHEREQTPNSDIWGMFTMALAHMIGASAVHMAQHGVSGAERYAPEGGDDDPRAAEGEDRHG